jgi:hypothetical protein
MDMDAVALLNAGQLKSGTLNKPPEFPGSQETETDENLMTLGVSSKNSKREAKTWSLAGHLS